MNYPHVTQKKTVCLTICPKYSLYFVRITNGNYRTKPLQYLEVLRGCRSD